MLWLPPLALYLLTFILAFQGAWQPIRQSMLRLVLVAVASMAYVLRDIRTQLPIMVSVPLFLIGLFVTCFFLHGELYARRPDTAGMTRFYLVAAAGSAAGTLLVGVIAPLVLRANYDLACTLVVVALIALAATWHDGWGLRMLWVAGVTAAIVVLSTQVRQYDDDAVALMRNFYGTLRVRETHLPPQSDTDRQLLNGTIEHGAEWFAPQFLNQPLTYYAANSGLGMAMRLCCGTDPKRVGVIGLGTGTVAAYGNAGDVIRFYEINPPVERLARHWFTFLHDSRRAHRRGAGRRPLVLGRRGSAALQRNRDRCLFRGCHPGASINPRGAGALSPPSAARWNPCLPRIQPVHRSGAGGRRARQGCRALCHVRALPRGRTEWLVFRGLDTSDHEPGIFESTGNRQQRLPDTLETGVRLWTDNYSSLLPLLKWYTR